MSKMLKQAAEGTFLLTIAQIVGRFMNFIYYILLLAAFKPSVLGLFFLLVSILAFFKSSMNSVMGSVFVRYIPEYVAQGKKERVVSTGQTWFLISLFVVVAGSMVTAFLVYLIYPQLSAFLVFAPFYLFFYFCLGFVSNLAVAVRDFKVRTATELTQTTISTVLLWVAVYLMHDVSVTALFYVTLASCAITVLIGAALLWSWLCEMLHFSGKELLKSVFEEQWRYGFSNTIYQNINAFMVNVDMLVLGVFSTPTIVGVYGMIKRIFTAIATFALVPVQSVVMPTLSYALGKGDDVRIWILKSLKWFFGISVLMAIGFALMAQLMFNLFFRSYAAYMWLSYIFFLVPIARSIKVGLGNYLRLRNKMALLVRIGVVALVANLIFDLLFVKLFGVVGVVVATILSEVWVDYEVIRIFDPGLKRTLKSVHLEFLVWGFVCLGLFFYLNVPLKSVICASIFTLGMIALMLRAMDEDEKQLFESYLKKLALFFHH